jgi:UDP-N-acetylmuramoyl-tripeptide--D-alanyl-D-alanine ligase
VASECAQAVGGVLSLCPVDAVFTGVSTDSRNISQGDLFVAIKGEHFDGADYAASAIKSGAVAVLSEFAIPDVPTLICPENSVESLSKLASWHRGRLTKTKVIGVTGSAGKTLTKDMITAVLSHAGSVVATTGSANNEIGLPMTLLGTDPEADFLVVELGARQMGDIDKLVRIARPDIGVVTNVGLAHVEIFGDIENTSLAKAELVVALPSTGWAVLNADDSRVCAMADKTTAQIVTFGHNQEADVRFSEVNVSDSGTTVFNVSSTFGSIDTKSAEVLLPLGGKHLASNASAAVAVGLLLGVGLTQGCRALSSMTLISPHRARVFESDSRTIIDDTYNANPESMAAALQLLVDIAGSRRKVAVLGEMRELGSLSAKEHERIGAQAANAGLSVLIAVGDLARRYLPSKSSGVKTYECADARSAIEVVGSALQPNDVVLIKASRALGLEAVVAAISGDLVEANQ